MGHFSRLRELWTDAHAATAVEQECNAGRAYLVCEICNRTGLTFVANFEVGGGQAFEWPTIRIAHDDGDRHPFCAALEANLLSRERCRDGEPSGNDHHRWSEDVRRIPVRVHVTHGQCSISKIDAF